MDRVCQTENSLKLSNKTNFCKLYEVVSAIFGAILNQGSNSVANLCFLHVYLDNFGKKSLNIDFFCKTLASQNANFCKIQNPSRHSFHILLLVKILYLCVSIDICAWNTDCNKIRILSKFCDNVCRTTL